MNTTITPSETYEVFETIGCGSVSTIYDGYDHILKREIAIKELRADFRGDTDVVEAFWGEATLLAGLNHANILRVHGIDRERHWIIMEPMLTSVDAEIESKKLSFIRIRDILRQTLEGLRYLHLMDRVHGQIRLDSLLVDGSSSVKLSNLSESDIDGEFRRPDEKQLHNAPEILNPRHFGQPGLSSDLYCVGIVALQLLAGDKFLKLFKGMDRKRALDPMAWSAWHASSEPIGSVQALVADIPSDLLALVEGLTQKQVGLRFASAAEAIGTISPQSFRTSSIGNDAHCPNEATDSLSEEGATVTYNSPNLYSPRSAIATKKKAMNWQELLSETTRRYPALLSRKVMLPTAAMLMGVCFLAIVLIPTSVETSVQADIPEPVGEKEIRPVRRSEFDEKIQQRPEPIKIDGSVKLVLMVDPSGPTLDSPTISVDGQLQSIKALGELDIQSEALEQDTEDSIVVDIQSQFKVRSNLSKSPINISGPAGTYLVSIATDSFVTQQRVIQIVARQESTEVIQMEPRSYTVKFSVNPPNAIVLIDGQPVAGKAGRHRQAQLPWGKHQMVVSAEGFVDQEHTINILRDASETFTLSPIETVSTTIDSFPQGAKVTIRGKEVGRTPLPWIGRVGTHDLRLSLPGFVPLSVELNLTASPDSQSTRSCWYLNRSQEMLAVVPDGN